MRAGHVPYAAFLKRKAARILPPFVSSPQKPPAANDPQLRGSAKA